jgi:hypothetical protein
MREFIDNERRYRRIIECPNAQFLDWGEEKQSEIGTSTIIIKMRKACEKLGVTLTLGDGRMMIKTKGSEFKTIAVTNIIRFLTQKVIRSQKITSLLQTEKHGATFETLKDNMISNKMLTNTKTMKSDAFFRFTVASRADVLPTPANIQQWFNQPRTNCHRCTRELKPLLAHILNRCPANYPDTTKRHNKVVDVVRRAIQEYIAMNLESRIDENKRIQEDRLMEAVRNLRPDLSFITKTSRRPSPFTVFMDVSYPYGRKSYGGNTLEKVYFDNMVKYKELAEEMKRIWAMDVQIIPIIVSSLGAVYHKSFQSLRALLGNGYCDKIMKIIGRRLSEAAVAGSLEIWRKYSRDMPHTDNGRAEQIMLRENTFAEDAQVNAEGDEIEIQVNEASQEVKEEVHGKISEEDVEQVI